MLERDIGVGCMVIDYFGGMGGRGSTRGYANGERLNNTFYIIENQMEKYHYILHIKNVVLDLWAKFWIFWESNQVKTKIINKWL